MILDPAIADLPVLYANTALLERIEAYAVEFLSSLEERDAATRQATRLILSRLADDSLSLRSVAKDMSMSVRTLQARLGTEGRRFGELVERGSPRLGQEIPARAIHGRGDHLSASASPSRASSGRPSRNGRA